MYPEQDFRNSFPNPVEVVNIEFGAGKGYFGKANFPMCFATDIEDYDRIHITDCEGCDESDCHHLDSLLDFFEFDFGNRKFNRLVFVILMGLDSMLNTAQQSS